MRIPVLVLIAVAATPLVAPASPQEKDNQPPKERADSSDRRIKELQKERIETLKELVESTVKLWQSRPGQFKYEDVLEAQLLYFQAELDAAEKESDRISLYKRVVETLKELEKEAARQRDGGRVSSTVVQKAKARRLGIEIDLEKAKARAAKEGK